MCGRSPRETAVAANFWSRRTAAPSRAGAAAAKSCSMSRTDRRMMAVDVKTAPAFEAGTPRALFPTPAMSVNNQLFQYDVTRDGKRFFIIAPSSSAASDTRDDRAELAGGPKR